MRPITFAHRGARIVAAENSIDAFRIALDQGASGLETDAWLSADGDVVLVHDERVRSGVRRKRVGALSTQELERLGIPTLHALYATLGSDYELSIDLKDPRCGPRIVEVARAHGDVSRCWLCAPAVDTLTPLRGSGARLVHSTRKDDLDRVIERHAAALGDLGLDAMNMHHTDWTPGLVSLFHRFAVQAFAWDAQETRHIRALLRMDVDAIYCDRPDRLVATVAEWTIGGGPSAV